MGIIGEKEGWVEGGKVRHARQIKKVRIVMTYER